MGTMLYAIHSRHRLLSHRMTYHTLRSAWRSKLTRRPIESVALWEHSLSKPGVIPLYCCMVRHPPSSQCWLQPRYLKIQTSTTQITKHPIICETCTWCEWVALEPSYQPLTRGVPFVGKTYIRRTMPHLRMCARWFVTDRADADSQHKPRAASNSSLSHSHSSSAASPGPTVPSATPEQVRT